MAEFYTGSSIKMCIKTTINMLFNCESNTILKKESHNSLIISVVTNTTYHTGTHE